MAVIVKVWFQVKFGESSNCIEDLKEKEGKNEC